MIFRLGSKNGSKEIEKNQIQNITLCKRYVCFKQTRLEKRLNRYAYQTSELKYFHASSSYWNQIFGYRLLVWLLRYCTRLTVKLKWTKNSNLEFCENGQKLKFTNRFC